MYQFVSGKGSIHLHGDKIAHVSPLAMFAIAIKRGDCSSRITSTAQKDNQALRRVSIVTV